MHTNFLRLLLFLLGFLYVFSVCAIPATRTKNLSGEDISVMPSVQLQGALKLENQEILVDVEEGLMERRVDLETQDYGGTGANKDHDPKSPGMHG
ncbi:hypothetical protein RJT34_26763 [Clitoria ternatea]|uniref:Uncharacterized protein n=1 Tax=Clitoria ternatea TaxID=43366 RepID=A0AAN9F7K9_CLITE